MATGTLDPDNFLDLGEIEIEIQKWRAIPQITGIFLDEFGNDFGNDGARRSSIVELVREAQMAMILNAFNPADVFSDPSFPIVLGEREYYLYESFGVQDDVEITSGPNMTVKGRKLTYLAANGLFAKTIATTTSVAAASIDPDLYARLMQWSARAGFYGFSFASPIFGAATSDAFPYPSLDWSRVQGPNAGGGSQGVGGDSGVADTSLTGNNQPMSANKTTGLSQMSLGSRLVRFLTIILLIFYRTRNGFANRVV